MINTDYALHLGEEKDSSFTDFIIEDNFFLAVSENGGQKEELKKILSLLKEDFRSSSPQTLVSCTKLVSSHLGGLDVDCAAGFFVNSILYVVTLGSGLVLLKRDDTLIKIVPEGKNASGPVQEGDFYIFTNNRLEELIDQKEIGQILQDETHPKAVLDLLIPQLKEKDDSGIFAIFVSVLSKSKEQELIEETTEETEESSYSATGQSPSEHSKFTGMFEQFRSRATGNKRLTAGLLIILFIILLYSVVFGVGRRQQVKLQAQVDTQIAAIEKKLSEAEDLFGLNTDSALLLLEEAEADVATLKAQNEGKKIAGIAEIEEKVKQKSKEITKQKEVTAKEFYDLSLIKKGSRAGLIYKEEEMAVLLNRSAGQIYTLNLEKKATETISDSTIKQATFVALSSGTVFYLVPDKGIYRHQDKSELFYEKSNDDNYGEVIDMAMFNGNAYLLNKKGQVLKQNGASDGFSSSVSYIKPGSEVDFDSPLHLVIDSSVYVLSKNTVARFTSGLVDGFSLEPPDKSVSFELIYTDADLNDLYLIDKEGGTLFVFGKEGDYKRQLSAAILKSAVDFVVMNDSAYVLTGDKIYEISLLDDGKVE